MSTLNVRNGNTVLKQMITFIANDKLAGTKILLSAINEKANTVCCLSGTLF